MILLAKGLAPDIPWNTISSGMIDTEALMDLGGENILYMLYYLTSFLSRVFQWLSR